MRRRTLKLMVAALGLGLAAFSGTAAAITPVASYKDVKVQPIDWQKPTPKTVKLKNGATLILLEDHRLPLINFYGTVRTGSLYDPEGKAGTASLLGTVLRTGGTKKRSWEQVDEEVDRLALAISTGIGNESGNASFEVLTENFVPALNLLFEMLREPAFDEEKIALAKEKTKENIRRQNDNPLQIALREVRAILYGANHPRGFSPTFKTVDAITKQDLIDFHAKYYFPSNMIIGVAGDFDSKKIASQIEKAMGTWPNKQVTLPPVPPLELTKARTVYLADKANASQSTILVTKLTLKEGDPDQYAMEVMDFILGSGGFTSRITEKVRSDKGLAYAAGSALNIGKMDPGPVLIYALSKSESTIEALDIMLRETGRIGTEPVSQAELDKAKNSLLNGAVFDYDKPEKVISETIDLSYYGMSQDLPEKRLKALETVTVEDVQRVAAKYLKNENLQILVVGAASKFDKPLTTIGPVTTIEIKDPTLP
jgi:zinc protease